MYKSAGILFIVCFFLYILFTRQPDYFDSEFTPGKIVLVNKNDNTQMAVQYPVGKELFTAPVDGWGASGIAEGESVTVIYNPTIPSEGSLYTFFAYWLKWPELLIILTLFNILFVGAVLITGKNQPEEAGQEYKRERKYMD